MDEIISSILNAESKSDEIINNASITAKENITNADLKAEQIKLDAIESFKSYHKKTINDAFIKANDLYNDKLNEASLSASELTKNTNDKISAVAKLITNELTK